MGKYFILEFDDECFTAKLAVYVVAGSQPTSAPVNYCGMVGLSQKITDHWEEVSENLGFTVATVPAGTVVTLPQDGVETARFLASAVSETERYEDGPGVSFGPAVSEIEPYLSNGRYCFTVEPGMVYEVHYLMGFDTVDRIAADDSVPAVDDTPKNTAYASTQTVNVDGKAVTFECYALKEGNGMTNYIKLRDLALLLNGSAAQFQVGWDGSVTITTKTAYTPNGSELSTPYSGDRTYQETNAATKVNGVAADLAAFVLNDDQGGGYTYYQLRDLGKALGFNVGWAADKGIFVETDKPYDANN